MVNLECTFLIAGRIILFYGFHKKGQKFSKVHLNLKSFLLFLKTSSLKSNLEKNSSYPLKHWIRYHRLGILAPKILVISNSIFHFQDGNHYQFLLLKCQCIFEDLQLIAKLILPLFCINSLFALSKSLFEISLFNDKKTVEDIALLLFLSLQKD